MFFFLISNSFAYVTYSDPNKCKLVSLIQPDIKGMLPKNVVESAIPGSMVEFFTKLEDALKKDGKISSWGARDKVREGSGGGDRDVLCIFVLLPGHLGPCWSIMLYFLFRVQKRSEQRSSSTTFLMLNDDYTSSTTFSIHILIWFVFNVRRSKELDQMSYLWNCKHRFYSAYC